MQMTSAYRLFPNTKTLILNVGWPIYPKAWEDMEGVSAESKYSTAVKYTCLFMTHKLSAYIKEVSCTLWYRAKSFTHVSVGERDIVLCSIKAFCSVVFLCSTQSVCLQHVTDLLPQGKRMIKTFILKAPPMNLNPHQCCLHVVSACKCHCYCCGSLLFHFMCINT